jgi:hypothetical protein
MTAYIADHGKKKSILEKRVKGLQHALKNEYSREKIEKEAERVRAAKLAVFKMEFSRGSILPAHDYEPTEKALEWEGKSIEDIIGEFQPNGT